MRAVSAFTFVALVSLVVAQNVGSNIIDDKNGDIGIKPSVRLDPYIRKALLRALTELENSDYTTDSQTTVSTDTTGTGTGTETLSTIEGITETLQTSVPEDKIQIHSFIVNGQTAFDNNTETIPTVIDNKISILSTTAGNVEGQVTATLPTKVSFNDIFQLRETSTNVQQVRSIPTAAKSISENTIVNTVPTFQVSSTTVPTTTTSTTTTTTTTTTPKPTHNDDGENIEEVNHRDVQVFQAPLVAAFTVHQDALGIPKRVVPIYQQTQTQIKTLSSPNQNQLPIAVAQPLLPLPSVNKIAQPTFITQQLLLQKQLEEKQKYLEEQLRQLQFQQRHQEELLNKQQTLLQQKETIKQNQFLNQQNAFRQNAIQSQVSVVPSVSLGLDQASALNNQQQLPNREAVDFLLHLRTQHREQFPLQDNHLPQGLTNFLQPQGNFHQGLNFNQIRNIEEFRGKQGNRVFRHENGVGNFGINNQQNFNRFNTFGQFQTNRFPQQHRLQQFNPDAELQQLLVQTGINGRAQEDFNIVSKVLSLNHGIPLNNNLSNRLPFDSRRHVRT